MNLLWIGEIEFIGLDRIGCQIYPMTATPFFYKGHEIIILPVGDEEIGFPEVDLAIAFVDPKLPIARGWILFKSIFWYGDLCLGKLHPIKLKICPILKFFRQGTEETIVQGNQTTLKIAVRDKPCFRADPS